MKRIFVLGFICTEILLCTACNKSNGEQYGEEGTDTSGTTVTVPEDPALAATIGFFMSPWSSKTYTATSYTAATPPATATYQVTVDASRILTKISPALFGNNSNPYMTQMVNQPALITHLTNLRPRLIRFPGGNISSIYFWNRQPGAAPSDAPAQLTDADGNKIDPGYWYGGNTADWTLSVNNYYTMLQQTGNEGIITVNYGYARYSTAANPVAAAAHLAADWVRADNGRTKYWEVGNESNGTWQAGYRIDVTQNKDGQPQFVSGDLYGRHFKVFADSMRKAATEIGKTIQIGAQLLEHEPPIWATETDKRWNNGVLQQVGNTADFYIVHSYFTPYNTNSNPQEILASATTVTKAIYDHVTGSFTANRAKPAPIALTEWNIFAVGSQQMVSQVAGMHAVMVWGEMIRNKFGMASRWDLANAWENGNDHGLFSQGESASGEAKWTPRPAFYYQYFFQKFLGDRAIDAVVADSNAGVNAYASTFSSGEVGITLVNRAAMTRNVTVNFKNFIPGERFYWYVLTGGEGVTGFSRKVFVNGAGPSGISGGPANYNVLNPYGASTAGGIKVSLPPMGVVNMVIEKK
ncbi:alpha-L-arabinofuranosidase [Chitinophaga rhizophila]|uniref:Alpha-L-arabinofuranosidase n=1 Tax=Chitinophaga rhizophila TaxID=2866212 RepID=A0ABS7GEL2_9BACT|nr:alpha-L-arabinofuranosidase [Chitinophaga rhizophila]MBW8684958.1 alpha-L-arabinofuranosidase [Chitinophaga rhizophila]